MSSPASSGRASPPTERVVRILDFLAGRPDQRFGVSELARRIGVNVTQENGVRAGRLLLVRVGRTPVPKWRRMPCF